MRFVFSVCASALALVIPAAASAAEPADAPTEESSPRTVVLSGADYVERNLHGCRMRTNDTTLAVRCAARGYASFGYEVRVPADAIDLRPRVFGDGSPSVEAGSRDGARRYRLRVIVGRGTHTIDEVRLRMDIPIQVDERPCVTDGEWARINVWLGGYGGDLEHIAAVFDTDGEQVFLSEPYDGFRYQVRAYRRCGSAATRKITFHSYADRRGWYSYWG